MADGITTAASDAKLRSLAGSVTPFVAAELDRYTARFTLGLGRGKFMRFAQWFAWAVLAVCVNAAARRLLWPGHLPSGVIAWAFNGGSLLVAALLLRLVQRRRKQAV